mmetsp:Transcript_7231/g.17468  ORF Transcript_7231/g.17468 Transcript_7231/m.17468 type:complete len:98 (-) Transcript_7231:1526-1819(-)
MSICLVCGVRHIGQRRQLHVHADSRGPQRPPRMHAGACQHQCWHLTEPGRPACWGHVCPRCKGPQDVPSVKTHAGLGPSNWANLTNGDTFLAAVSRS